MCYFTKYRVGKLTRRPRQFIYLLTPASKSKAHKAVEHSLPKEKATTKAAPEPPATPLPTKGTEVPAAEVEASAQAAVVRYIQHFVSFMY